MATLNMTRIWDFAGKVSGVRARVQRGARWLDSEKNGWEKQINTGTLNIESCKNCMLGQLFGQAKTWGIISHQTEAAVHHGFLAKRDINGLWGYVEYELLRREWITEIKRRVRIADALEEANKKMAVPA